MRVYGSHGMAVALVALLAAAPAAAQTITGGIQGTVTDEATGVPMLLATVVASSPNLQGQASELTDASGQYLLSNLPAGTYSVLFLFGDAKVRRDRVDVSVGKVTTVNARVNQQATEVVTIRERSPTIDAGSTKQGATFQKDYLRNVPSRGRTYEGILGAAAGSQDDRYGTSFSGSTSPENSYILDGVNTTDVKYGLVQSPLLNSFIQEIEVITGGYNAEFGRATGGVVNVVTKTGSNELHGSMWANVTPFEAKREPIQSAATAFRGDLSLDTDLDFGFDVGGPIVKDRLWFYVGFAPFIQRTRVTRVVSTQVDRNVRFFDYGNPDCPRNADGVTCDGDNNPATHPAPGCELEAADGAACETDARADLDASNLPIREEIDRSEQVDSNTKYQVVGKLSFAVGPDHQGQISFIGTPETAHSIGCMNGTPTSCNRNLGVFTADASLKWTSKLDNNRTQIDAVLGWHRQSSTLAPNAATLPNDPARLALDEPRVFIQDGDVNGLTIATGKNWDASESDEVLRFCRDEKPGSVSVDQFPRTRNCPYNSYLFGGPGGFRNEIDKRLTAKVTLTQRIQALGHHQLKAGADVEVNQISDHRQFSGGRVMVLSFNPVNADDEQRYWESLEYVRPNPSGTNVCGFVDPDDDNGDGNFEPTFCDLLHDGIKVDAQTLNWAAFIQDSWSMLPNLTINAGLRYEEQIIGIADQLQGNIDPITGQAVGATGLKLGGLLAPRIGIIFDWTKEGRSKVYANWGRFYESVPMDINERSFGGEMVADQYWLAASQCTPFTPTDDPDGLRLPSLPATCPRSASADGSMRPPYSYFGFGNTDKGVPVGLAVVVPGTTAQAMDELVLGLEYEILEDLRVGLAYQNRRMVSVIEDVSTDGGATYYFANPGVFDASAEARMREQIASMGDGPTRSALIRQLEDFRLIRRFDKAVRDYNAVQLTVAKRFSRSFMVQGSYTYSVLEGNYPGLFQPDSGQLDPNLTSQWDVFELLTNRFGRLPGDRPHQLKLDGYYTFDLEKAGRVTTGVRFRAQSGRPIEAIGASINYGRVESYILPRGTSGRTAFGATADLHLAYARRVGDVDVELYFELFNVLNNQYETAKDNQYTLNFAHPISGGDESDLPYLKTIFGVAVNRNLNWRNTTARAAPLTGRIGVTISF